MSTPECEELARLKTRIRGLELERDNLLAQVERLTAAEDNAVDRMNRALEPTPETVHRVTDRALEPFPGLVEYELGRSVATIARALHEAVHGPKDLKRRGAKP